MNCFTCVEAQAHRVGGTLYGCAHDMPRVKPLRGVPAGIAEGSRHHTPGVA